MNCFVKADVVFLLIVSGQKIASSLFMFHCVISVVCVWVLPGQRRVVDGVHSPVTLMHASVRVLGMTNQQRLKTLILIDLPGQLLILVPNRYCLPFLLYSCLWILNICCM